MFEAELVKGNLLKKILESIKELITDASFDCSSTGISLQAMDSAHVSLVHLLLKADGFDKYRCDKNLSLGVNMLTVSKMLRSVSQEDSITIKAMEDADTVTFVIKGQHDSVSEFELKLVEIETDQLGIPESGFFFFLTFLEYSAVVKMPSAKFKKICSDITLMGDTCTISTSKKGVTFSAKGEDISGSTTIKQSGSVDVISFKIKKKLRNLIPPPLILQKHFL
jgi:proliferating cell nuclear antigen